MQRPLMASVYTKCSKEFKKYKFDLLIVVTKRSIESIVEASIHMLTCYFEIEFRNEDFHRNICLVPPPQKKKTPQT